MCIDICPVGALTSGAYRYKTRPWEMNHVGTICTHCGDGCKTTLGVRRNDTGMEIVRGDNRDKSGINNDFLCVKGRYAFDFAHHKERLTQPLIRKNGKLTPATWEEAFELIGKRFREVRDQNGGSAIGVIGSNRTTNEENYLLSKFARVGAEDEQRRSSPHRRLPCPGGGAAWQARKNGFDARCVDRAGDSADRQRPDEPASAAGMADSDERALAAREALRHQLCAHQAAAAGNWICAMVPAGAEAKAVAFLAGDDSLLDQLASGRDGTTREAWIALRDKIRAEQNMVIAFGSELRGNDIENW